jgi:hypothetical protein
VCFCKTLVNEQATETLALAGGVDGDRAKQQHWLPVNEYRPIANDSSKYAVTVAQDVAEVLDLRHVIAQSIG